MQSLFPRSTMSVIIRSNNLPNFHLGYNSFKHRKHVLEWYRIHQFEKLVVHVDGKWSLKHCLVVNSGKMKVARNTSLIEAHQGLLKKQSWIQNGVWPFPISQRLVNCQQVYSAPDCICDASETLFWDHSGKGFLISKIKKSEPKNVWVLWSQISVDFRATMSHGERRSRGIQ